mmetsp:Transcript_30100/g.84982  ORF Transcript_30100/g.84982 Transcript_30100/m.84982 type:complete len:185 (-) Transcript_30100:448-1002(-)
MGRRVAIGPALCGMWPIAAECLVCAGRRPGEGRDLMMVFTCKVCETRAVKSMSRHSYEKGVVLVRCPGCQNLHLIADHLGWFGEPGTLEDFLAEQGETVFKASDDGTLELTQDQIACLSKVWSCKWVCYTLNSQQNLVCSCKWALFRGLGDRPVACMICLPRRRVRLTLRESGAREEDGRAAPT